ncbi:uncharacterized protein LOC109708031 [Ananas comosus]|uniref:Uncharacterized protein LOC109708031 n=1 Tax=Ananas comosus TaxID=4615 RepID=A0A6P5ENE9_ANACO|nr:uncharacterized protein LOC109708031 [Ananas comosus]
MKYFLVLLVALTSCFFYGRVNAGTAACANTYSNCYGISFNCPQGCPNQCEVDCNTCKPYCPCDKPGAVCHDPRFIGGDGIKFYFHGKKNKDFCLVTDSDIHVNAHFIGKQGKGRDFTWVQSIGILFGSQQFYVGARKVATWHGSDDNMHVQFNGADINIPSGDGEMWTSPEGDLQIKRVGETNSIVAEVVGVVKIGVRVVPITEEESRIHGYGITEDDCFAHLELSFKFSSLSNSVSGVLGQTYVPGYRSPVKIGVPMPVMGGAEKYSTSHLFATDCAVSKFGLKREGAEIEDPPTVACGAQDGIQGIVCKR